MRAGYQVGQVVQGQRYPSAAVAAIPSPQGRRDRHLLLGAHHYIIDPFQHFQPFPILARLAAEPGDMKLTTSMLLLPLTNPVDVAKQVATLGHITEGRLILSLRYRPEEWRPLAPAYHSGASASPKRLN